MSSVKHKPFRISRIGLKLSFAIAAIIVVTLMAAIAAWLAMVDINSRVQAIGERHLPLISTATQFTELTGSISAISPQLISARFSWEKEVLWDDLEMQFKQLSQLVYNADDANILDADIQTKLVEFLPKIQKNLQQLNNNASHNFNLQSRSRHLSESLRWTQASFLDEIAPILEDSRFNTQDSIEQFGLNTPYKQTDLQQVLRTREALMQLNADGNLAIGLIIRASSQTSLQEIDGNLLYLGEIEDRIIAHLATLKDNTSALTLRQLIQQIIDFSKEDQSIPHLRKQILLLSDQSQDLLNENKTLFSQLKIVINEQVKEADSAAQEAAVKAQKAVTRGRNLIISMALFGLIIAFFVGWFYVGRSLLARLNQLQTSMSAIAEGHLDTPVDTQGKDEISQMAQALLIFRNSAAEVEDANAQAIISNTLVGLISTDEHGLIEFMNPNARRLFNYQYQDLIGADIHSILDQQALDSPLKLNVNITELASTIETLGKRQDGSTFHLDISVRQYLQRHRKKILFTLVDSTDRYTTQQYLEYTIESRTKDLTAEIQERKRTELALRSTSQELVQSAKLASLGQLSASIAHELNQPLSAIRYHAHNSSRMIELKRAADSLPLLDKIEMLADKMAKIINHLKVFARKPTDDVIAVNVPQVIDSALELFQGRITRLECKVERHGFDQFCPASGDPIRLEQVLVNVIGNALDAMSDQTHPHIIISANADDKHITLAFSDNGCGISDEQKQQIFYPFFTTKEIGAGLGLGLSISRKILLDIGGDISVQDVTDSPLQQGTTISITLKRYLT
jgi:two-component system phosphoglycerate transport system sensor histidine kinase PgtB